MIAFTGVLVALGPTGAFAATADVTIEDGSFSPATVTITPGDTVTWTNQGFSHSVTADDGSFDSSPTCPASCLSTGDTFSFTFTTPGSYAYYCRLHGASGGIGMAGVVVVVAPATTAPTATTVAPPTSTPTSGPQTTPAPAATTAPVASPSPSGSEQLAVTGGNDAPIALLALSLLGLGFVATTIARRQTRRT